MLEPNWEALKTFYLFLLYIMAIGFGVFLTIATFTVVTKMLTAFYTSFTKAYKEAYNKAANKQKER